MSLQTQAALELSSCNCCILQPAAQSGLGSQQLSRNAMLAKPAKAPTTGGAQHALDAIEGTRPVALAYDGSLEGMLTSIFVAFASHGLVEDIAPNGVR